MMRKMFQRLVKRDRFTGLSLIQSWELSGIDIILIHIEIFFEKKFRRRNFASRKSFVERARKLCSTKSYHAQKGQHLAFPTHYQPYPHHTPNALHLLPNWLHGSKISKSRNIDFPTFSSDPQKFRFTENILAAPTSRPYHDHKLQIIIFQTHYQPWLYDTYNELDPLSKLRIKTQDQENTHFGQIELKKSCKTLGLDFGRFFLVFLNYLNNHKPDEDIK